MTYEHGKLDGAVQLFWPSGHLKRETFFHKGMKQGWDRLWNEQNILIDEGCFEEGMPIAKHCRWHDQGLPQEEVIYYTPKRFDKRCWDLDKKLVYEGVYDHELKFTQRILTESGSYHVQEGRWNGHKLILEQGSTNA